MTGVAQVVVASCVLVWASHTAAYKQYIDVPRSAAVATGSNAVVVQVETSGASKGNPATSRRYAPNLAHPEFKNVDVRVDVGAQTSDHSDTVGKLLFGRKRSIAKGIDTAYVFHTNTWLRRLATWDLNPSNVSLLFPGPVVNHSWVGTQRNSGEFLKKADYSALSNNILHVAGVRRAGAGDHLMAGGFNSLVVGGAVKNIATAYPVIDHFYAEGRTRPHLVGPYPHASAAAPIVAAAAVRLNALAVKQNISFVSASPDNEQLPVALVKAILMASASGDFTYSAKSETHVNSFGTVGVTANGLDKRYGMGMLNVRAAENILKSGSGSPDSVSPPKDASINSSSDTGFDYFTGFSVDTEKTVSYEVRPERSGELSVSLAWLADVYPVDGNLRASVYDLDLELLELTLGDDGKVQSERVAISNAAFDTTENIRMAVERGHTYKIRVSTKSTAAKPWNFALAWTVSP